jgi:hypothetical protein
MLDRAVSLLQKLDHPPSDDSLPSLRLRRDRATTWMAVVKAAWGGGLVRQTLQFVSAAIEANILAGNLNDLSLLHFVNAEALALEMRQRGYAIDTPPLAHDAADVAAKRSELIGCIIRGGEVGATLQDDIVVHNAASYFFNHHLPIIRARKFEPPHSAALERLHELLQKTSLKDPVICCAVADALATSLELKITAPGQPPPPTNPLLPKAMATCEAVLPLAPPLTKRRVVATLTRLQRLKAGNVSALPIFSTGEPESQIFAVLEAVRVEPTQTAPLLKKAADVLKANSSVSVEVVARCALEASNAKLWQQALDFASFGGKLAPKAGDGRWVALMALAEGTSLSALVDPATLGKTGADELRLRSLERLATAAETASFASAGGVCFCALRGWWNCAIPLMMTPNLRKGLTGVCERVAKVVMDVGRGGSLSEEDATLCVKLMGLFLETMADSGQWAVGNEAAEWVRQNIPPHLTGDLMGLR